MKKLTNLVNALFLRAINMLFAKPARCYSDPQAGSDQIPNHFIEKFDADLKLQVQQKQSRLEPCVMADYAVSGFTKAYDSLGASEAQLITGRDQDMQGVNTVHSRRWIDLADYDWFDYVDSLDELKVLVNPQNKYVMLANAAHNRTKDRIIIAALFGSARETTGYGQAMATTMQALPAGQKVADAGTNMTLAKLRTALELMNIADAGSPEEGGERFFFYTANQLTKLMSDSTVTSSDFNSMRALQNYTAGDNIFMGMRWVRTELLPKTGNIRLCAIVAKEGVGFGAGVDLQTDISVRKDKRGLPLQVYMRQSLGCVRGQDKCVVQISCDETA